MTEEEAAKNIMKGVQRSASPTRISSQATLADDEKDYASDKEYTSTMGLRKRRGRTEDLEGSPSQSSFRAPSESEAKPTVRHTKDHLAIEQLKKGDRVNVLLRNMCIFLTKDGAVFMNDPCVKC
jgi:hypothetical protein